MTDNIKKAISNAINWKVIDAIKYLATPYEDMGCDVTISVGFGGLSLYEYTSTDGERFNKWNGEDDVVLRCIEQGISKGDSIYMFHVYDGNGHRMDEFTTKMADKLKTKLGVDIPVRILALLDKSNDIVLRETNSV